MLYIGETSETLKRGSVSIGAAGGGGLALRKDASNIEPGCCGAVGGRIRVGLGKKMEIGAEGGVGWVGDRMPWGGKLSYKVSPIGWVGIVAGLGMSHDLGYNLGGDLALLISPKIPLVPLRLYFGGRAGFAGPIDGGPFTNGGLTVSGVVPLGLALQLSIVRIFAEAGAALSRSWVIDPAKPSATTTVEAYGGYVGLGVTVILGKVN